MLVSHISGCWAKLLVIGAIENNLADIPSAVTIVNMSSEFGIVLPEVLSSSIVNVRDKWTPGALRVVTDVDFTSMYVCVGDCK